MTWFPPLCYRSLFDVSSKQKALISRLWELLCELTLLLHLQPGHTVNGVRE